MIPLGPSLNSTRNVSKSRFDKNIEKIESILDYIVNLFWISNQI